MSSRRSAKVLCKNDCFWITPRQFWALIRQDIITYLGEPPLVGKYRGLKEDFLITSCHVILNSACPEHTHSFRQTKQKIRSRRGHLRLR